MVPSLTSLEPGLGRLAVILAAGLEFTWGWSTRHPHVVSPWGLHLGSQREHPQGERSKRSGLKLQDFTSWPWMSLDITSATLYWLSTSPRPIRFKGREEDPASSMGGIAKFTAVFNRPHQTHPSVLRKKVTKSKEQRT